MLKRNRLHVAIKGNKTTKDIKFLEASPHSNIYIFRLTELPAAGFKSITHNLVRVLKGRRRCENTRTDQTGASPLIAHTSAKTVLPTIFPHEKKKEKKKKAFFTVQQIQPKLRKSSFPVGHLHYHYCTSLKLFYSFIYIFHYYHYSF